MRNKVAETRDILKKVNNRHYKNLMLFHMWWKEYWVYDSEAEKIDWVWLVKWTLEYIQGYIYWAFGYNDRN